MKLDALMRGLALLGGSVTALGCGEKIQEQYFLEIVGPPDQSLFDGADRAVLELGGQVLDDVPILPRSAVDIVVKSIDPAKTPAGRFTVKALGPATPDRELLAFGQTPEIELEARTQQVRIFVQKPATFGRSLDLPAPVKGHVAVAGVALPKAGTHQTKKITVPVFGTGIQLYQKSQTEVADTFSNLVYVYDPLYHQAFPVGNTAAVADVPQLRAEVAAWADPGGNVLFFGGSSRGTITDAPHVTSQLDVFQVVRGSLFDFGKSSGTVYTSQIKPIARAGAVLAGAELVYAFGGHDDDMAPLDTIVSINLDALASDALSLLEPRMMATRVGHTATVVGLDILLFGGAPPGGAVAEIFQPRMAGESPRIVPVLGATGPGRRQHVALTLPGASERVLIVGGLGDDGAPLGSSVLYVAEDPPHLEAGPITLMTPRSGFVAFVLNDDLVVAGGVDAQGALIGDAEIFDVHDFSSLPTLPVHPRARATATVLPNQSVIVIGGEEKDGLPSVAVEVYQPRRKN